MMRLLAVVVVLAANHCLTGAWDDPFRASNCYTDVTLDRLDERMPLSMANLVALIEKMEREHTYMNPEKVAEALLLRYRIDGTTFNDRIGSGGSFTGKDHNEAEKQKIIRKVLSPEEVLQQDTFEPREECSMHFMLSHSVDLYPFNGIDEKWEAQGYRTRRSAGSVDPSGQSADTRLGLSTNYDPANHPLEYGVIYTTSGPVAAGTLLAGIMVRDQTSPTVQQVVGETDSEYMPTEMKQKRLNPLHTATLAGDLGQQAVIRALTSTTSSSQNVYGPSGEFLDNTAAPKLFAHETNYGEVPTYLTRAEIFAGIDAMIIQKFLMSTSSSYTQRLSDLLRMYYSDHGLPGKQDLRACNRMEAFRQLFDFNEIEDEALYFTYAYSDKFPELSSLVQEAQNNYDSIETSFRRALSTTLNGLKSFVNSYDYSDYERCPVMANKEVPCENMADVLVVYSGDGGTTKMENQRQYIAHLGQLLGVGVDRSRIGVMNGKSGAFIEPMTNFSNVADWGSNFTEDSTIGGGSSGNMRTVLSEMTKYYNDFYTHLLSNKDNASAHSQVVVWNVPSSIQEREDFLEEFEDFNRTFPDVYFLVVGTSRNNFEDIMEDPKNDFFDTPDTDLEEFAATLAKRICQIPSMFVYPACDPNNQNFTGYNEGSHKYEGFVSPNFTTYIRISPKTFRFSESVKLTVDSGDVELCSSRESPLVEEGVNDRICASSSGEIKYMYLCDRWIDMCPPIYLSRWHFYQQK